MVDEPTLLPCPRALHHAFVNPPREGAGFTCATLQFAGGDRHSLVAALPPLPPLLRVPLAAEPGLAPSLSRALPQPLGQSPCAGLAARR